MSKCHHWRLLPQTQKNQQFHASSQSINDQESIMIHLLAAYFFHNIGFIFVLHVHLGFFFLSLHDSFMIHYSLISTSSNRRSLLCSRTFPHHQPATYHFHFSKKTQAVVSGRRRCNLRVFMSESHEVVIHLVKSIREVISASLAKAPLQ